MQRGFMLLRSGNRIHFYVLDEENLRWAIALIDRYRTSKGVVWAVLDPDHRPPHLYHIAGSLREAIDEAIQYRIETRGALI